MAEITAATTLQELAVIVSEALEQAGILATLSGGAAVSIYTDNQYQSYDLDFVTAASPRDLARVVEALGFVRSDARRLFEHPASPWLVEFPSGPLGFGNRIVDARQLEVLQTPWGALRVITPTLCVMDRLAAYCHWKDRQCWDQAVMVIRQHEHAVDWPELSTWARAEGMTDEELLRLRREGGRS